MTLENFSSGFDILVNSFASTSAFGREDGIQDLRFNEYEKSVYLTNAQEELVLSLYTGKNAYGESFEQTEELRRNLSPLVCEAELSPISTTAGVLGMDSKSKFFSLPDGKGEAPEVWFITYEEIRLDDSKGEDGKYKNGCMHGNSVAVHPTRQDEYNVIKKNPFRGVNKRRALRLDLSDNVVEIKSTYESFTYYIRYIKKLTPIVLEDFTADNVSVNGVADPTECALLESLHQRILELAVSMALRSKGIGKRNENKNAEG